MKIKMYRGALYWLCFIFNLFTQVLCLKDVHIIGQKAVEVDDTVTLTCKYDMEHDILHKVRWYFDNEEFFGYAPNITPHIRTFEVQGLTVDVNRSNENNVTLKYLNRKHSGKYICEVAAEAPSFHISSASIFLTVAELPKSAPVIIIDSPTNKSNYSASLGDEIKATCLSGESIPAVNFTWTVNNFHYPSHTTKSDGSKFGLQKASSVLNIRVDNQIMKSSKNSKLVLRCETNIFDLYQDEDEIEIMLLDDNDVDRPEIDEDEISDKTLEFIQAFYHVYKYFVGAILTAIVVLMIYWSLK